MRPARRAPLFRTSASTPRAAISPRAGYAVVASVWLLGIAPAAVLPASLNRFVYIKLTLVMVACAIVFGRPAFGRLSREAMICLGLAGLILGLAVASSAAPLGQLIGRAPRYEGVVSVGVYVASLCAGARLLGPSGDPRLRSHLLRATSVAGCAMAVVALLEVSGTHLLSSSASRPGSLLGNATEQGAYGVGILVLALVMGASTRWTFSTTATVISGVLLVATSASRGALLGAAAALALAAAAGSSRVRRTALIVFVVLAAAVVTVPLSRDRALLRSGLSTQTISGRWQEWQSVWTLVAKHPLGVGPSGFLDAWPGVEPATYARFAGTAILDSPHSLPLQIVVAGGVPLLVVAAIAVVLLGRHVLLAARSAKDPWPLGAGCALAGWAVVMLTHFTAPGSTPFFCLLAGSLLSVPIARQPAIRHRLTASLAAGAASVILLAAAVAEIPLRQGLLALADGRGGSTAADFALAHDLRPWDADLDAQIAHALVISPVAGLPLTAASTYLERAGGTFPQDPWIRLDMAQHELALGNPRSALDALDRAQQLAPTTSAVYLLRGQVRLRMGDQGGAISDLRTSADLAPEDQAPLRVLATAYAQAGQLELAALSLQRAEALSHEGS